MAEERIVEDEFGRKVKIRKTKEGVDVTEEVTDGEEVEEEVELSLEIPEEEEDDEDLVGLSPEEAAALKKQKAEAAERRKKEYDQAIIDGNALLDAGEYEAAEKKFEEALQLDEIATEASVGYWRAKTENFQKPDVLIEEYLEAGIESLEYDLGLEATDIVKADFRAVFEKRLEELKEEEKPLAEEVEGKQERRHEILSSRLRMRTITAVVALVPMLLCILMSAVFGMQITTTRDATGYIVATAVMGGAAFLLFLVFLVCLNNFLNALRIYRKNENLASTEEGVKLLQVRAYMELCEALLSERSEEDEDEDEVEADEEETEEE